MSELFESHRGMLLKLAYQMSGSVALAEDLVQDTYLKWRQVDPEMVQQPAAYLRRILTRLCLDVLKSAAVRREVYVGPWLPEPVIHEEPVLDHDVSVALLLALERLSPLERAAFLLHDILDVEFEEIGRVLERSTVSVRKLASRARLHMHAARPRYALEVEEAHELVDAFLVAARSGDAERLTSLLVHDAQLHSDGGGKRVAALRVIYGAERIVRFFVGLARRGVGAGVAKSEAVMLNGLPGLILRDPEGLLETCAFAFEDTRIVGIYMVRNPDKLKHLSGFQEREVSGA